MQNEVIRLKRLFIIVLDSVGIGALPDAAKFGDAGADTMARISKSEKFHIPNLRALGIGNIQGLSYLGTAENPLSDEFAVAINRQSERSRGSSRKWSRKYLFCSGSRTSSRAEEGSPCIS